ncbi:hypothetical protein C922_01942 [Plasmodium inui San Antonio 1]|uniref:Uncharacterized protein n=1 Tax=Plasmodium inui San Antonio 1 TaxID=1237626 RepID=W7A900_9APIC|nr:hypothetical protein C922_01942 [Plasmodium inui San Antonio 1]EUD67753.1 hypothetical protein C922_01942 [Plasmodium inui San Antonio 1]
MEVNPSNEVEKPIRKNGLHNIERGKEVSSYVWNWAYTSTVPFQLHEQLDQVRQGNKPDCISTQGLNPDKGNGLSGEEEEFNVK